MAARGARAAAGDAGHRLSQCEIAGGYLACGGGIPTWPVQGRLRRGAERDDLADPNIASTPAHDHGRTRSLMVGCCVRDQCRAAAAQCKPPQEDRTTRLNTGRYEIACPFVEGELFSSVLCRNTHAPISVIARITPASKMAAKFDASFIGQVQS